MGNFRTRRAVHRLVLWTGKLSTAGGCTSVAELLGTETDFLALSYPQSEPLLLFERYIFVNLQGKATGQTTWESGNPSPDIALRGGRATNSPRQRDQFTPRARPVHPVFDPTGATNSPTKRDQFTLNNSSRPQGLSTGDASRSARPIHPRLEGRDQFTHAFKRPESGATNSPTKVRVRAQNDTSLTGN